MNTRPIMTAAELNQHKATEYGRNYSESCDGYEDMEAEGKRGWRAVSSWGRDGWDLGAWPYVVIYTRTASGRFEPHDAAGRHELMQIVEGDRTVYRFITEDDLSAAIDYLFLWYAADHDWAPLTYDQRDALNVGALTFDAKWRGPFSWERADAERAEQ